MPARAGQPRRRRPAKSQRSACKVQRGHLPEAVYSHSISTVAHPVPVMGVWGVGAGASTLPYHRKETRGFRRRRRILQGFQSLSGSPRAGSLSAVPGTSMGFFFLKTIYLFNLLIWLSRFLVAAHGLFDLHRPLSRPPGHHRDPHLRTPAGGWTRIHRGGGTGETAEVAPTIPTPPRGGLASCPESSGAAGETAHSTAASWSSIHGHRHASSSSSSSGTRNFLPPAGEASGNWTTPEVAEAPATPAYPLTSPNNGSACNPRISRCSGGVHHLVSLRATPAVPAALAVPRR